MERASKDGGLIGTSVVHSSRQFGRWRELLNKRGEGIKLVAKTLGQLSPLSKNNIDFKLNTKKILHVGTRKYKDRF